MEIGSSHRRLASNRRRAIKGSLAKLLFLAGLAAFALPVGAQSVLSSRGSAENLLPENWETRLRYEHFVNAPISRLSGIPSRSYTQREDARKVAFQIRRRGESVYLLFLGEDEWGGFPLLRRGNVSIKRDVVSGEFHYMTVMTRNHPECFIRMYPGDERTFLDVVLFGVEIHHRLIIPQKFSAIVFSPIAQVIQMTRNRIRWDVILNRGKTENALEMIEQIRSHLPRLKDLDDGAYNQSGEPVYIATGKPSEGGMNCSGFAKWIVDGYYFPLTGRYTDIGRLKKKLIEVRGNRWSQRYESERDPYFGLDWSRNLAMILNEARGRRRVAHPEDFDVRKVDYLSYREDIGYPVARLKLLLFLLAQHEPGAFYLGSLNREHGSDPIIRQHVHLAILIPYFSADGTFDVAVFEINRETSLASLEERYRGDYIHLVRIEGGSRFQPAIYQGADVN
jgi:hypothetical protein